MENPKAPANSRDELVKLAAELVSIARKLQAKSARLRLAVERAFARLPND